MTPLRSFATIAALVGFASLLSADVLTVGPPGSGSDFDDIQSAVDAAERGDVVLVGPGSYLGFTVDKAVVVHGAGVGQTNVSNQLAPFAVNAVRVQGVPAGEVAVVAGLRVELPSTPFGQESLVEASGNTGTVLLHDVELIGAETRGGLEGRATTRLILSASRSFGGGGGGLLDATYALSATGTRLWVIDSSVEAAPLSGFFLPLQKEAVQLSNCDALFAASLVRAGELGPTASGEGADAVLARSSLINVASSRVFGGDGATGAGGYAFRLFQSAIATSFADSIVEGGLDAAGLAQQDPVTVDVESSYSEVSQLLPTLTVSTAAASAGDAVQLQLRGTPGASGQLFASLGIGPGFPILGVGGDVFLEPGALVPLGALTLDGSGQAQVPVTVPSLPGNAPALATFQWVDQASGGAMVSNPAFLSLL
ncbi:MAG: hypothetical protein AAF682_14810 [Planctomycetota bacterium]